ncbi:hypothetical protein H5410_060466 [Solanum commersonii]|uniref:DUF7746 domain-containing protein n=1 Tax=Solanum commersonii TaxID=4109 RepID=A0A9J5W633_SOLCO|nr:hypothetical protein H5410_060466 [Solanum commersonii]
MYYYPRPTPQDVLLEEHEHIITNSYNGKEIYEWNIDGYTDRQIYTTVHRMHMYNSICKANKNSDKTIVDIITIGFTSQLKGCWDYYLNMEQRDKILQVVKVMELPQCNSSHWKSKFIDGLPALFAKRVRKTFIGDSHSINYDNYTYGKLISSCIQEGLSLCNEINSHEESSTSEDLKAFHQKDYISSDDDCLPCQQGLSCENEGEEDDLYKIYSHFKELSINVIDNDKVIELLQIVKDPEIRAQIIDTINNTSTS